MAEISVAKSQPKPSQQNFAQALEAWLPLLLQLWRQQNKRPGPSRRLTESEIKQLSRSLQILSQGLTRDRRLAGQYYFSDQDMLGTYLLYFWPISYRQACFVLNSLPYKPRRVLELGAGAGPLGAACFDRGITNVTMADRSQAALHYARLLSKNHGIQPTFEIWDPYLPKTKISGKYDLIALQHVVNELWTESKDRLHKIETLLNNLKSHLTDSGFLLIIEPALTPTSRALLQLRDNLLRQGWHLVSPCLHQYSCPALRKETDSCHMDITWQLPEIIKPVVKNAGFKKKELKISYCLLQPSRTARSQTYTNHDFLIVSEPLRSKNKRIRFIGCGPAGRLGLALKTEQATEQQKTFLTLRRGDIVRITNAQKTEHGIRITSETKIKLLNH